MVSQEELDQAGIEKIVIDCHRAALERLIADEDEDRFKPVWDAGMLIGADFYDVIEEFKDELEKRGFSIMESRALHTVYCSNGVYPHADTSKFDDVNKALIATVNELVPCPEEQEEQYKCRIAGN